MLSSGFDEEFLGSLINEALESSQQGPWNITRHFLYTHLCGKLGRWDGYERKCLSISNSANFGDLFGLSNVCITEANYPEHGILCLKFPSEAFDFGTRWTKIPLSPSHPIHHMAMTNHVSVPIVTWIVLQKKLEDVLNIVYPLMQPLWVTAI